MPRSAQSILEAAERYGPSDVDPLENRLTELLATALRYDAEFVRWFCGHAGVSANQLDHTFRSDTRTQVLIEDGRMVDLEICLVDQQGSPVARVWSENKIHAPFQPEQLENYDEALKRRAPVGEGRLVVTLPARRQQEVKGWQSLTWEDLGAELAGRLEGPKAKSRPTSPLLEGGSALELLRYEMVSLLAHHDLTNLMPLEEADVVAIKRAGHARQRLQHLFDRAERIVGLPLGAGGGSGWNRWRHFETAEWARSRGGWIELKVSRTDGWACDQRDEPALGVGASFWRVLPPDLTNGDLLEWHRVLRKHEFSVRTENPPCVRYFRTKYLADLVSPDWTLDAQGQAVGDWARESINLLTQLDPDRYRSGAEADPIG